MKSTGNRFTWYDRNPTPKNNGYDAVGVAPHVQTSRWTYTVPASRKFALQLANGFVARDSAAGAAAHQNAAMAYTPSGGSLQYLFRASNYSNTVGAIASMGIGGTIVMLAGDVVTGYTQDASTGGGSTFSLSMQGLEFDA